MTADRWQQINVIFQKAMEIATEDRTRYLHYVCGDDTELHSEVMALLAAETAATFLDAPPAVRSAPKRSAEDLLGHRIGAYRVTRLLGRGGMGEVYEAVRDDEQFDQKVALKIVRHEMNVEFVRQRFLSERQILASLRHPNVAHLLDGGTTTDGLSYFVMEYIEGEPITDYCRSHKLPLVEKVQLFRQVCAAVQHAHQKLVVHRDLKPNNILVTKDGTVKLLDFGIAKVLDPALQRRDALDTAPDVRLMTPDYASPEQVRGLAITTASDIYSLGAVFYELLTEMRPHKFSTLSPLEIERVVCETEVLKPSEVADRMKTTGRKLFAALRTQPSSRLHGDLDNIVLMAMRKEPERRYQSVEQFSEDLQRYLEGRPIIARADTIRYRTGKFLRRNRLPVTATAVVFLSLVTGLAVATYQARRAERRFQQVRKLAHAYLFDVNAELQSLPGSTKAREIVVKTALEYLDSLAQEAGNDTALQLELAQAYDRVGNVQGNPYDQNRGDSAAALRSFEKAQTIYQRLLARDKENPELLKGLTYLQPRLATLYSSLGRGAEAEDAARATIQLVEKMRAAKIEVEPWIVAASYHRQGDLARRGGDFATALAHQRRGVAFVMSWIAEHPERNAHTMEITAYTRLAMALREKGDLEEALEVAQRALRLSQEDFERNPSNATRRTLLARHQNVARVLGDPDELNLGQPAEAIAHYRKALEIARELSIQDSQNAQDKREVAMAALFLAMMLRDSKPAEAASLYQQSVWLAESLCQTAPDDVEFRQTLALANRGLAYTNWRLGKAQEALPVLRKALEAQLANYATDPTRTWSHRNLSRTYEVIGNLLLQQGDPSGAREMFQQGLDLAQKLLQVHPRDPHLQRDLAFAYENFGRFHSTLAADSKLPHTARRASAQESITWYQRGFTTWEQWLTNGIAKPYAALHRTQAAQAMAASETMLSRLGMP